VRLAFLGNFGVDYSSENHHKRSLESLGHEVVALQEGSTDSLTVHEVAAKSDAFIWVHTHGWQTPGATPMSWVLDSLKDAGIPTVTYHLDLWLGLQRQRDLETDDFYRHIGHFFTVDKLMADWFNENTDVKGHYVPAGVFHEECYLHEVQGSPHQNDVIFVGSKGYHPEWRYRPQLISWLAQTYGDRFTHVGGDGIGTVRGDDLNRLYGASKVAVGDTLCLHFDYPYYWSDRVYETLGRGGFMIHPYIKGMEAHFEDKKHLVFYEYGNFGQLHGLIDYFLSHDDEREAIRRAGHEHVKANHTYRHRWQQILETIAIKQEAAV
jgi:hypothetical protein